MVVSSVRHAINPVRRVIQLLQIVKHVRMLQESFTSSIKTFACRHAQMAISVRLKPIGVRHVIQHVQLASTLVNLVVIVARQPTQPLTIYPSVRQNVFLSVWMVNLRT